MAWLLGTDIESEAKRRIRGFVARAGGTVDQLPTYAGCTVEDINIPDGGFGRISGNGGGNGLRPLVRAIRQELLHLLKGARVPLDRKTVILDMHGACLRADLKGRYDCTISSNLIEHSPNPVWLLLNFHFITKEDGYQFHAIPHYRYTYDRFRLPTPVSHLLEDFVRRADESDMSHVEDYVQSAVEKDGWQREFHRNYPLTYPFIHFHVFDEHNVRELFETVFTEVKSDVLKTGKFSDNIVTFRNRLNPSFTERYGDTIRSYFPAP
jgi:hypothetical protein